MIFTNYYVFETGMHDFTFKRIHILKFFTQLKLDHIFPQTFNPELCSSQSSCPFTMRSCEVTDYACYLSILFHYWLLIIYNLWLVVVHFRGHIPTCLLLNLSLSEYLSILSIGEIVINQAYLFWLCS